MLINLKNNLHWLIYSIGLLMYFIMLVQTTLTLSIIWLLFILYTWLVVSIITQQYCFKCLLYVFCSSGIIVALSLFFIKGIEELPFPIGAILFKEEGILQALLLLFVFSIPIVIYNHKNVSWSFLKEEHPQNIKKTLSEDQITASEEWEEATIEDLESGSYEPV